MPTKNNKPRRPVKYPQNAARKTTNKNVKNYKKNVKKYKKAQKKKSLIGRIFKWSFLTLLILFLAVTVIGGGYVFAIIKSTPPLDVETVLRLSEPSSLYDKDSQYIDTIHSEISRTVISFDQMPQHLKDAYVSIEDQRFYDHKGIDPRRILGSFVTDIKKIFKKQNSFHGGSTITQQLLKNTTLSDESSKLERKIKEIWLATNLETQLSKDQILTQYLNTIPVGGIYFGVEEGAKYYFNKSASQLNLIECAYLAGVTQAPTTYNAFIEKNKKDPTPYLNRTKTVLGKMKELGKITDEEYNTAIADLNAGKLQFNYDQAQVDYSLDYECYIDPALEQVREDLKAKYKYTDEEITKLFANGGLQVYTNMDRSLQDATQEILNNTKVNGYTNNGNYVNPDSYKQNTESYEFQASATVVNYKTGEVLAMVGGRGNEVAKGYNRAYYQRRSPGSTTKPITAYGPAINEKTLTAASIIDDSPGDDIPSINKGSFLGPISLREGLRESKNAVASRVVNKIGKDTGLYYGEKFGIKYSNTTKQAEAYQYLALGQFAVNSTDADNNTVNDGTNTYIMAAAYGTFGNNGVYTTPKLYSSVKDSTGKTILEAPHTQEQIFTPSTAYIMYDMLKGSREFTGYNAQFGNIPTAGKTGTTEECKDLWFTGLTPYLSASVWLGYDNNYSMYDNDSNTAAYVWAQIMKIAHNGYPDNDKTDIQKPSELVECTICTDSGKLPTSGCPTKVEYFVPGTEPTSYCGSGGYSSYGQNSNSGNENTTQNQDVQKQENQDQDNNQNTETNTNNNQNNNIENNTNSTEHNNNQNNNNANENNNNNNPDDNNIPNNNPNTTNKH